MTELSENELSPQMNKLRRNLLPLIAIFVGVCIVFWGFLSLMKAKESLNWPTTAGIVVSSSVYDSTAHEVGVNKSVFHAEVIYEFNVNDTQYSSKRISFGDYGAGDPSHAGDIVSRYPKGMNVMVYYQPDKPIECLLEPGIKAQSFYMSGFGLVFFIVGILLIIFLPKPNEKQDDGREDG